MRIKNATRSVMKNYVKKKKLTHKYTLSQVLVHCLNVCKTPGRGQKRQLGLPGCPSARRWKWKEGR